jgi:hypothetical protein
MPDLRGPGGTMRAHAPSLAGDSLPRGLILKGQDTSGHMTYQLSSEMENPVIRGRLLRVIVLVAGAVGLLALFETAARAGTNLNHCEPVQRI